MQCIRYCPLQVQAKCCWRRLGSSSGSAAAWRWRSFFIHTTVTPPSCFRCGPEVPFYACVVASQGGSAEFLRLRISVAATFMTDDSQAGNGIVTLDFTDRKSMLCLQLYGLTRQTGSDAEASPEVVFLPWGGHTRVCLEDLLRPWRRSCRRGGAAEAAPSAATTLAG